MITEDKLSNVDIDIEEQVIYISYTHKGIDYRTMLNFENKPEENKLVFITDRYDVICNSDPDSKDIIGTQLVEINLDGVWA